MCYQIDLRVVLKKDLPHYRAQLSMPKHLPSIYCEGKFPDYQVTQGICACKLVHQNGAWVEGAPEVIQHFLNLAPVKRVEVLWYWASERPAKPKQEKLEFEEFAGLNHEHKLSLGTCYRVSKKRQF